MTIMTLSLYTIFVKDIKRVCLFYETVSHQNIDINHIKNIDILKKNLKLHSLSERLLLIKHH